MTKQSIKEQIAYKLESILENTDTVFSYDGRIPKIEMDILLENVRSLYELYVDLNKSNEGLDINVQDSKSDYLFSQKSVVENVKPEPIQTPEPVIETPAPKYEAPVIESKQEIVVEEKIQEPVAEIKEVVIPEPVVVEPVVEAAVEIPVVMEEEKSETHIIADQLIAEIEEKTHVIIEDKPVQEESPVVAIEEEKVSAQEVVAELIQEMDQPETVSEIIPVAEETVTMPMEVVSETSEVAEPKDLNFETAKEFVDKLSEVVAEEPKAEEIVNEAPEIVQVEELPAVEEVKSEIKEEPKSDNQNLFSGSLFSLDEFSVEAKPVETKKKKPKSPLDLFAPSSPNIAESYQETKPNLNDRLGAKKSDNSIASKIQQQPITDLKKAIGINEKFLFINELFDGSMQDYNSAIEQLNNGCKNLTEAKTFLGFLKTNYRWTENKVSISLFESLVERRFILPEEPPF